MTSIRLVHQGFKNLIIGTASILFISGLMGVVAAPGASKLGPVIGIVVGLTLLRGSKTAFFVELNDDQLTNCLMWQKESIVLDESWSMNLSPGLSPGVPRLTNGKRSLQVMALTSRFQIFGITPGIDDFITEIGNHIAGSYRRA